MCEVREEGIFDTMKLNSIFVTVGTTNFNALIKEITTDRVLSLLKDKGCHRLVLQVGNGKWTIDAASIAAQHGIRVEQYDFKKDGIESDILAADLIVGHAGAGTCMDILEAQKPGLIVINDSLMDNHQNELAHQLSNEGYIQCCTVSQLADTIQSLDNVDFKCYKSMAHIKEFVKCFEDLIFATV